MSVDAWIALWSFVLWASMGALGLLAAYILAGYVGSLRRNK